MLKEIHEQADAVAETIADRTVRARRRRPRRGGALDEAILRDVKRDRRRRLRHLLPRRPDRPLRDRGVGADARSRWTSPPSTATATRWSAPATSSSASRSRARPPTRWRRCASPASAARPCSRVTNIMGSQATRDADGVLFTRAGLEIGVAATKTFVCQVAVMYLLGAAPRRAARHAGRRAAGASSSTDLKRIPHCIDAAARGRRRRASSEIADEHWRQGVLPLPRPPRRPAGRARGRAQAQGDLLHRRPTPTRPAR